MKCKKCGKEFEGIVDVCSNCGEKIYSVKMIKDIDETIDEDILAVLEQEITNDFDNVPIQNASSVIIPVESYVGNLDNDVNKIFESSMVDNFYNNENISDVRENSIENEIPVIETEVESQILEEQNNEFVNENPNIIVQNSFDSLNNNQNQVTESSINPFIDVPEKISVEKNIVSNSNSVIVKIDNRGQGVENNQSKKKKIRINNRKPSNFIIQIVIMLIIALVCIFFIFTSDEFKEDDMNNDFDSNEIINGLNMGTYYETKSGESLKKVSKITFKSDNTYVMEANICSEMYFFSGNYEFKDGKVVVVVNSVDENGKQVSTNLTFNIVDDNKIWLEEEFGCVTNGENNGMFIYNNNNK